MSKKIERSHAKVCRGTDNIISLNSVMSRHSQDHAEPHTANPDQLRRNIIDLIDLRKKRSKALGKNLETLPNSLISSLTDEELRLLVEFFDSFEGKK